MYSRLSLNVPHNNRAREVNFPWYLSVTGAGPVMRIGNTAKLRPCKF